jgi:hypothetical protein
MLLTRAAVGDYAHTSLSINNFAACSALGLAVHRSPERPKRAVYRTTPTRQCATAAGPEPPKRLV